MYVNYFSIKLGKKPISWWTTEYDYLKIIATLRMKRTGLENSIKKNLCICKVPSTQRAQFLQPPHEYFWYCSGLEASGKEWACEGQLYQRWVRETDCHVQLVWLYIVIIVLRFWVKRFYYPCCLCLFPGTWNCNGSWSPYLQILSLLTILTIQKP